MCFLFVGRGFKDFLKSPWTAFHGSSFVLNTVSKDFLKTHLHLTHPGVIPLMNEPANAVSLCA
jgi:hypothetical protein